MSAIEAVERSAAGRAAPHEVRRHGARARQGARRRQGARAGVRGHRHRHAPRRPARVVHGAQGLVRPGRRAHLPAALADDPEGRGRAVGQGAPRQAVLPARSEGQGGAHEGNQARRRRSRFPAGASRRPIAAREALVARHLAQAHDRERAAAGSGSYHVAGVDEVGRGCLAGPVVAARRRARPGTPHRRARAIPSSCLPLRARSLYEAITRRAIAWAVASVESSRDRPPQHPSRVARAPCGRPCSRWCRCRKSCWSTRSASRIFRCRSGES